MSKPRTLPQPKTRFKVGQPVFALFQPDELDDWRIAPTTVKLVAFDADLAFHYYGAKRIKLFTVYYCDGLPGTFHSDNDQHDEGEEETSLFATWKEAYAAAAKRAREDDPS